MMTRCGVVTRICGLVTTAIMVVVCRAEPELLSQREVPPASVNAPRITSIRPPTRMPAATRVAAFGDVHGDLNATRAVLRLVGAIDAADHWIGGRLVVVQTGDQLDRGDDERAILDMFSSLKREAQAAGGAVYPLLGNHELMNAIGDFRYVTAGGFAAFSDVASAGAAQSWVVASPAGRRGRAAAFAPGGPYAAVLASHNVVQIVGDTVFVHGSVLPSYAPDLEAINDSVERVLRGDAPHTDLARLMASDSPVWSRAFSEPALSEDRCAVLSETLRILGVARMVVGHTPQPRGVTSACDEKVWRIDVGMARHYGGTPAAIVIEQGVVTVLRP